MPASDWAAQQLGEFLAAVTSRQEPRSAGRRGIERAAEALDAEVAALVRGGRLEAVIGYPSGAEPTADVLAVARGGVNALDVPGVGVCHTAAVGLDDAPGSWLVVARSFEAFTADELGLLRGMARVLGLSLRNLDTLAHERRLMATLQERQLLLERLSRIQRSISHRAPLQVVLDAITAGAVELIDDSLAALRLVDPDAPTWMTVVSSCGVDAVLLDEVQRSTIDEGVGGQAIREDRLVVVVDYPASQVALPAFRTRGLQAAMAAPVHENGRVVGSLIVSSYSPGRRYSISEQEALLAFAEHASLALTDAKTVEAMREAQRAKDMFLAMVSHELKTPLTVVMGVLLTIERHRDVLAPEVMADLLTAARERGSELQRLIDRVLQGARAELASSAEPVWLPQLVSRAVHGFEHAAHVELGDVPEVGVMADPIAVNEVLGTLLENAVSHAPAGSEVRIAVDVTEDEIRVQVANPGALPDDIDAAGLFEPFQRGTGATSSGVGLGLYIAQRVATSMRGRIEAASADGWVTFTLCFPFRPARVLETSAVAS